MSQTKLFLKLSENLSERLMPASVNLEKACWEFYTNSNPQTLSNYEKSQEEYAKIFKNKKLYEQFLTLDKKNLNTHDAKQLKDILRSFDEEINTGDEIKELRIKENEIAKKYNSYIPKIDGKEVSKAELVKITQTETDECIRKQAYKAKIIGGDLISKDLVEFVKIRNNFAKTKGYNNFFEYKLNEDYDTDTVFLDKLIYDTYAKAKPYIEKIQQKRVDEYKEFYKTKVLQNYHFGLLLKSNPEKRVNDILKKYDILNLAKKIYAGMGYDINTLEKSGKLTLDLYPRKGKNTHGFCFGVEAGKDSRILANLTNNIVSLNTLNHELGHCVYDLGLPVTKPFLDRQPASSAFTEAIAMMMGDIIKKEDVLKDILSPELLSEFKNSLKDDEANFISKSLLIIDFERSFYNDITQNPKILWKNLKIKYLKREEEEDNEWATIPHYLSHPAYYQNYFRASLMKAQIYNHLKSVLGSITENEHTAKYLNRNIFRHGALLGEYELIKMLTGKEFSEDDFIKNLE